MSKQISITEEMGVDILNMLENRFDTLRHYSPDVCDSNIRSVADVRRKYVKVNGRKPTLDELCNEIDSWKEFRRAYKLSEKICKAFGWTNPYEKYGD